MELLNWVAEHLGTGPGGIFLALGVCSYILIALIIQNTPESQP